MLINERDDGSLFLLQAAPRHWFEDGKRIEVAGAPTYYGPLSLRSESHAGFGKIRINISLRARKKPARLTVRLRHPEEKPLKNVLVNGVNWTEFDVRKELVRIENPALQSYEILGQF
jgi:hypothetical protein